MSISFHFHFHSKYYSNTIYQKFYNELKKNCYLVKYQHKKIYFEGKRVIVLKLYFCQLIYLNIDKNIYQKMIKTLPLIFSALLDYSNHDFSKAFDQKKKLDWFSGFINDPPSLRNIHCGNYFPEIKHIF